VGEAAGPRQARVESGQKVKFGLVQVQVETGKYTSGNKAELTGRRSVYTDS
jgi:hypothetical protein